MNEDERIKKLMRAGLHDPKNDYKLFIKETNWRAKPKNSKTKVVSYLGCTSFSSRYHQQFIPTQYELDLGVWGENIFMLPDQESIDELRSVLNNFKNNKFEY